MTRSSHELVDHTSEVTLRLRASSFPGLVVEAARAFAALIPERLHGGEDGRWRIFRVEGPDRAGALVDWLNQLVYYAEVDLWAPAELVADAEEIDESVGSGRSRPVHLEARARGRKLTAPFVAVKAATLHGATVAEGPDGLEAEVTLDV